MYFFYGVFFMGVKNHFKHRGVSFLMVILAAVLCLQMPLSVWADEIDYEAEAEARKSLPVQTNSIENWPQGPAIGAESAILMDADTGTILYAKDIYRQAYPASTTKLITALLTVENCAMDEIVAFSHEAVDAVPWDGSNIGMDAGQQLTVEQALYAILVASANEVSNAVGEHISGSMDAFALLMTQRAKELGCNNTNFANTNGLPDPNHYTCAYDLALIAREFFSHELLCKMSSTYSYYIPPTEYQPDEIDIRSHNRLLPDRQYAYEYLVGSKTGYTDSARQTLVSCAEKDGMRLICVILKEESPYQFEDTIALFDYGFSNFQKLNIAENETTYSIDNSDFFETKTDIFGSSRPIMEIDRTDYVIMPTTIQFEDLTCELSYDCEEADAIATLSYSYHGQPVGNSTIRAVNRDVPAFTFDQTYEPMPETELIEVAPTDVREERVIFINVKKIIIGVVITAAVVALIFYIVSYIRSYHFAERQRDRKRRNRRKKDYRTRWSSTSDRPKLNFRKKRRKRRR